MLVWQVQEYRSKVLMSHILQGICCRNFMGYMCAKLHFMGKCCRNFSTVEFLQRVCRQTFIRYILGEDVAEIFQQLRNWDCNTKSLININNVCVKKNFYIKINVCIRKNVCQNLNACVNKNVCLNINVRLAFGTGYTLVGL